MIYGKYNRQNNNIHWVSGTYGFPAKVHSSDGFRHGMFYLAGIVGFTGDVPQRRWIFVGEKKQHIPKRSMLHWPNSNISPTWIFLK